MYQYNPFESWMRRYGSGTVPSVHRVLLGQPHPRPLCTEVRQGSLRQRWRKMRGTDNAKPFEENEFARLLTGYLCERENGGWDLHAEGWVYRVRDRDATRPERLSSRLHLCDAAAVTWQWLLMRGAPFRKLVVSLEKSPHMNDHDVIGEAVSDKRGLVQFHVPLPTLTTPTSHAVQRLTLLTQPAPAHTRVFPSSALCIPRLGVSVVSDIDDTVKHTEVSRKRSMIVNTLMKEFTAVAGMAELYRVWESAGAVFHYVSTSPFQLGAKLEQFLSENEFPLGSLHLNSVGWRNFRFWMQTRAANTKPQQITRLLVHFPHRRFILVGDSAQRDPSVYTTLAQQFPKQIAHIIIRQVPNASPRSLSRLQHIRATAPEGLITVLREEGSESELTGLRNLVQQLQERLEHPI